MKSIKELLESEYLGKEIEVYQTIRSNGSISKAVDLDYHFPHLSNKVKTTMKVIGVAQESGTCCGYNYNLLLEDGFWLAID